MLLPPPVPMGRAVEAVNCPVCAFPAEMERGRALPCVIPPVVNKNSSGFPVRAGFPHAPEFLLMALLSQVPHT